jgi:hypothetical protein
MVRFGWPVKTTKYPVQPSERDTYQEDSHASPVPFPSSTTSTVPTNATTTTAQTTHFLSLPLTRKCQEPQVDPPQRLSMFDLRTYQAGLDHQREQGTSYSREKSLPPTPSSSNEDEEVHGNHIRRTESPAGDQSWSYGPSSQDPQPTAVPPPARPSPSQAKIALAQAALAIGLPHSMPQASASSSRSDVTSMGFLTVPQPSRRPVPPSSVRRVKSFHQLSRNLWRDGDGDDSTRASPERPRRSRRISLGPSSAFDSDGKGNGTSVEGISPHVTPPRKSLIQRASFWNRKRNDIVKPAAAPPPPEHPRNSFDHLSHLLPSLPPLTPLHVDTNMSRSSHSSQTDEQLPPSPPGLNRCSESRNRPLPPNPAASSPDLSVQTLKTQSFGRQRPATAESATDRSRTLSYYAHPPGHSSPLAPTPSHPDVATLRPPARPRSHTNPAFFHRLSANIFSFSSSSSSPPTGGTNRVHVNNSPKASPRPSTSKLPPPKPRLNEESPAAYVDRLLGLISKADVASVLASRYALSVCEIESGS